MLKAERATESAFDGDSADEGQAALPYVPRLVVWLLIVSGLVTIGLGMGLRALTTVTSQTTDRVAGKEVKVSTTRAPFSSDTFLAVSLGLGGVLVLCGGFYTRISKVTLPGGGGIELDAQVVKGAAVAIKRRLEERPADEAVDSAELAAMTAAATNLAAAKAVEITNLAAREPAAAELLASVSGASADAWEIRKGRLPKELWDRLAESALDEILGTARGEGMPEKEE